MGPHPDQLLSDQDPAPVEWVGTNPAAPVLLVCEHAGQAIPAGLGDLGIAPDTLASHRGWDIGAERLARAIAQRLDALLVLQRYSRLVIDCNRPPGSETAIPTLSDGTRIPGNAGLSAAEAQARIEALFNPYNHALVEGFAAAPRRAAFSIHSFTPCMNGQDRPWHAGFLTRRAIPEAERMIAHIAKRAPDHVLAINQPYQISEDTDWFIPVHAEPKRIPHALIEIRNDQLETEPQINHWADLLAGAITHILDAPL